jgi:hypothetical protein
VACVLDLRLDQKIDVVPSVCTHARSGDTMEACVYRMLYRFGCTIPCDEFRSQDFA